MKKIIACLLAFLLFPVTAFAEREEDILSGYITTAIESGLIFGDENGDFQQDKPITRAEFSALLVRFLDLKGSGINTFTDMKNSDWFAADILAASYNGLIFGYEDGAVRPQQHLKCEDAVSVLGRFYKLFDTNPKKVDTVSDYAKKYFSYALANKLFLGTKQEYTNPQHNITKGEALALLYKYDLQSVSTIHFLNGYPKLSEDESFNNIAITLRTNRPCTIYYDIVESGDKKYSFEKKLTDIEFGNVEKRVSLIANLNKSYDIYFKAVTADGTEGKIRTLKGIQPFAFTAGDGSKKNPYIIYNALQLSQIKYRPDRCYKLGQDIVLENDWKPIDGFSGSLDGNGFKITGLCIDNEELEIAGLFSTVIGGMVKNLSVDGKVSAKKTAGIIAGSNKDGVIQGCTVTGYLNAKTNNAGGICGINRGVISDCLSALYCANASSFSGGISGQNYCEISRCLSAVNSVLADMYAGGIAGTNYGGEISDCVAACMDICDTMTHNSGRITTNKSGGKTYRNYCFDKTNTNAINSIPDADSQNGLDATWSELLSFGFYNNTLNWSSASWKSTDKGYKLICPRAAAEPVLIEGETVYNPIRIRNQADLRKMNENEKGNYILANDITLTLPWKSIGKMTGFSGTFDGNGHTVFGLDLRGEVGMFSNIAGGTVRNLTLKDAVCSVTSNGAVLAACNYGYIENCDVYATARFKRGELFGSIAGENYGQILNCDAKTEITALPDNVTIGGIAADNSGMINGCSFDGGIESTGKSAIIGGISGYDTDGAVSECYADVSVDAKNKTSYIGGICGIASGSEIYKCASDGNVAQVCSEMSYTGGVSGMSENSQVYCAFSTVDMTVNSQNAYLGGVVGFNSGEAVVQNTYSLGTLVHTGSGEIFTAGICGYSNGGFIMQNVAINPAIISDGNAFAVIGGFSECGIEGNFSCENTLLNSKHIKKQENNGTPKSLSALKNSSFYFMPIADGGALGWASDKYDEPVWKYDLSGTAYTFPVLIGVKNQEFFKMPTYK